MTILWKSLAKVINHHKKSLIPLPVNQLGTLGGGTSKNCALRHPGGPKNQPLWTQNYPYAIKTRVFELEASKFISKVLMAEILIP